MSQEINLLNPALRRRRDWLAFDSVAAMAGVAALGVGLAHAYVRLDAADVQARRTKLTAEVAGVQAELQTAQATLAARKSDAALAQEVKRLGGAVGARKETLRRAVESTADGSVSVAEMMRGFSRHVIDGVWLTGFSVLPEGLEIRGRLLDSALLPVYIRRLNAEPAFRGRRFAALDMHAGTDEAPAAKAAAGGATALSPPAGAAASMPSAAPAFVEFALRASAIPAPSGAKP